MKRINTYMTMVALAVATASCAVDKVYYDFDENKGPAVTFASGRTSLPGLTAEMNGEVAIPLYRGNTKGTATVEVALSGSDDYSLADNKVTFADGEDQADVVIRFDYADLSAAPSTLELSVVNADDLALNAVSKTTFTAVKALTYEKVGTGVYYSDFWYFMTEALEGAMWEQDLMKAKEGDYYMLPDCWTGGVPFLFYCDGETVDWYTLDTGVPYGSGNITFVITGASISKNEDGLWELVLKTDYDVPAAGGALGIPSVEAEVFTFPEGFEF